MRFSSIIHICRVRDRDTIMRDVCESRRAELARRIYKKKEAFPPLRQGKRVKSDAFTRLQETYVDTIDVAPVSNFSIT